MSKRRGSSPTEGLKINYGWEWAFDALANDSDRRLRLITIPDTIARGMSGEWHWLFTRKNGTIAKKKLPLTGFPATVDLTQLMVKARDRLVHVASRVRAAKESSSDHTISEPPAIAMLFFREQEGGKTGCAKLLQPAQLLDWLEILQGKESIPAQQTQQTELNASVVMGLQAFIPSESNIDQPTYMLARWQPPVSSEKLTVSIERYAGCFHSMQTKVSVLPLELATSVELGIRQMTDAVVGSLARATGTSNISSVELVFVVDDDQKPWFRYVHSVDVIKSHRDTSKAGLPSLQHATGGSLDSVSSSLGPKCGGMFCVTPLSSLSGLYRICQRSADKQDDDFFPDNGQRFKIGNNSVLLAHAQLSFLHQTISEDDEEDLVALKWQEADNILRAELGRTQPAQFYKQVLVCANCHHVYSELNRARELGFRRRPHSALTVTKSRKQPIAPTNSRKISLTDQDEMYDNVFLEELAKHSDEPLNGVEQNRKDENGPELDDGSIAARISIAGKKDGAVLPTITCLTRNGLASAKPVKKTTLIAIHNPSNNQTSIAADEAWITRIKSLENELEAAKSELTESRNLTRKLEHELVQTRNQCALMLKEKDEQHRRQLLERDLEFHSRTPPTNNAAGESTAEEMAKLFETIDELNRQLDAANAEKEAVSQQNFASHRAEIRRIKDMHRTEIDALRLAEHSAKEQCEMLQSQLLGLQTQVQVANMQSKNAEVALDELTKRTLPALEEKNRRLERQLSETLAKQQAQPSGIGQKEEAEAMEKRWRNKVDYLKAQLASEMKCKEELGAHLANVSADIERAKQDKKQALLDQEQSLKSQIERAKESFAKESEDAAAQLASAQAKIVTLQANVTDLVQELTMTKAKEANVRLAMEKMAEEQVRLTRQLVDVEGTLESLQAKAKHANNGASSANATEETNRVQMEALMRRLDNERQYLKTQLEAEQEAKDKYQQQVLVLQRELQELESTAELAARSFDQQLSSTIADRRHSEQTLRSALQCSEEEKALLSRQLRDVQAKFTQAREQALLDRDAAEIAKRETMELQSQVTAANEEVAKEKQAARSASERMAASLTAVKASLQAMEQDKNVRIQRLEGEVSMYLNKLAATEGEILVREEKIAVERAGMRREFTLKLLALTLRLHEEKWRVRVVSKAFHRVNSTSIRREMDHTLNERHATQIQTLEDELNEQYALKCDQIAQALNDERLAALKAMKEAHDRDRQELDAFYQQEKDELRNEMTLQHSEHIRILTEKYERAMSDGASNALAEVVELRKSLEKSKLERESALSEAAKLQETCEKLSTASKESMQAQTKAWKQQERSLKEITRQLKCQLAMQSEDLLGKSLVMVEKLVVSHSTATASLKERYERHVSEQLRSESARLIAEAQAERTLLEHNYSQRLSKVMEQHQRELEQERALLTAHWSQEADRIAKDHSTDLKAAVEQAEMQAQKRLDEQQRELNDRKATALMQCTSKWKRELEEMQNRLETEKHLAYEQGVRDREGEWQQAAVQIKAKQKEELEQVEQEAVRAIQAADERHRIQVQVKLEDATRAFEARLVQEIELATQRAAKLERATAKEEFEVSIAQERKQLDEEHTRKFVQLRDELTAEMAANATRQQEAFDSEKRELIEQRSRDLCELQAQLEAEWKQKLKEVVEACHREHHEHVEKIREQLADESDDMRHELEQQYARELTAALEKQRDELAREQEDAIAQVQEDSDKLLEQVEAAMTELKTQKERLERELGSLRAALEEAEDGQYDARETLKNAQKQAAFEQLRFIVFAFKQSKDRQSGESALKSTMATQREQLEREVQQERDQRKEEADRVARALKQVRDVHEAMLQALTSYKRDELVAHRSASSVLANEIAIVTRQMDEVLEIQAALEKDILTLQQEAQSIEAALRQALLPSGEGSSLSMAAVAKKRRLNEEFEALLEQVERKKAELRGTDKTLAGLRARREDKEKELKALERALVEILVAQQKQVLAQLSSAKSIDLIGVS